MKLLEHKIGYLFKVITDKIKIKADADLKKHGLTITQTRVLTFLNNKGGEATQKEIEEFLQVSHPTIVGVVSRMENNGFLITWLDPSDRRNKIVKLTDKSISVVKEIKNLIRLQDEKMLHTLTQEQIKTLEETLKIICKNLD